MTKLWDDLRSRKLVQWGAAYLAGAWLLLQLVGLLAEPFGLPPLTTVRVFAVLLAIGFFAALLLAWYHGERGEQRVSGAELLMLGTLFLTAGFTVALVTGDPLPRVTPAAGVSGTEKATAADPLSLAVLPFNNLSDSNEDEYFAEGVATEILNTLASVPDMRVAGETSSFSFRGKDLPLAEIAGQLNVRYLLEGNVRREGELVRISARLVDTTTGFQLWAETYDRQLSGLVEVQVQIARSIAAALRVRLGTDTNSRSRSQNEEAYDLYLRGIYDFRRRNAEPAAARQAMAAFRQAIELDSSFALAHAGLARAQVVASVYLPEYSVERGRREAIISAGRALQLDSTLSEARSALAYALWSLDRDYAGAEREFSQAIAYNPSDAIAHQWFGSYLRFVGRTAEAIRFGEQAVALDPFVGNGYSQLGASYALAGRYAEAEAALERRPAVAGVPRRFQALARHVYAPQGRFDEAREALRNDPNPAYGAYIEALAGRPAEARRLLAAATEASAYYNPTPTLVYLALGERDSAFVSLDRWAASTALGHGESPFDPHLAPLHGDPRWDAFLRRLKLTAPAPR